LLQNVQLTEAACVHLPVTFLDQLLLAYGSQHHRTDPRVLDVLLRYWRHSSLYYPQPYQPRDLRQSDDVPVMSVISVRELSLGVALAFIDAVRSGTLKSLSTLHLTAFYTGQYINQC